MGVSDIVAVFRRGWLWMVLGTLLGIAAAAGYTATITPKYETKVEMFVAVESEGNEVSDMDAALSYARQVIPTYIQVATSQLVIDPVIEELGLDVTWDQMLAGYRISSPPNTALLDITVISHDPELAVAIADATADSLAVAVDEVLAKPPYGTGPVDLVTTEPALVPDSPVSPSWRSNLAFGALVGLVAGIAVAGATYLRARRRESSTQTVES